MQWSYNGYYKALPMLRRVFNSPPLLWKDILVFDTVLPLGPLRLTEYNVV